MQPDSYLAVIWQRFGPYHLARLRAAADALRGSGLNVTGIEVAATDQYSWDRTELPSTRRVTLFPTRHYDDVSPRTIRQSVFEALDALQPAAVCINGWAVPEAVAALKWCRAKRRRAILMSETFASSPNPLKRYLRQWRVRQFDAAIVGGRLHAEYLTQLGYPREKVYIGYDVVDNEHFSRPTGQPVGQLAELAGKRFVFANTRFLERKGIDALIRAYARYCSLLAADGSQGDAWHLVISGSGAMERAWKALARELGVAGRIHWPGFLQYDELPYAYQTAGVFAHLARSEPWGLVVNEAAAARLPLIVGRQVGAACELVRHGENGFIVDPDDLVAVSELLLRVTRMSDDERRRMGAASERLAAAFGPKKFGEAVRHCVLGDSRPQA